MKVEQITVGLFEMNCYIVSTDQNKECFIIDPGDDAEKIISYIQEKQLVPQRILLTHGHIDHARKAHEVQNYFNIKLHIGEDDIPLLEAMNDQAKLFGLEKTEIPIIDSFFKENRKFSLTDLNCTVTHTPGHSPGSYCILFDGHVFVGDVLFLDSIGRSDLYGGNHEQLLESIRQKLMVLPDDTIVYPGHGSATTIGREKKHNPFLNSDFY